MTYQALVVTDDLALTVPTKLNENARTERFLNVVAKSATFTVWGDDSAGSPKDLYLVTTSTSTFDVVLPAIASADAAAGRVVTIMKADAAVGTANINPNGSELINGSATSVALSTQFHYRTLVSDGTTGWFVISSS
tara:strand:- start:923 stop:1330 length:408 start_codon:yes stop_codon:yes gene_type:complete